ncbi:cytokine receptor isoform X1 [Drosophila serrata]|uniref:cytokine receptor isoform X1 n=2 Tax=Drosophila serrata TaxID=7274 RepID=UPI000A1D1240|nr:cytokine receptor isoform X1 [Drosophila serrata]
MAPLVPQALELLALLLLLQVGARATVDPGWLVPDKVESAIGGNFTISCTLNETYFRDASIVEPCTAKDLYFKVGKREYRQHPDIWTFNSTTVLFSARNAEEQEGEYMCMCRDYVINTSKVYVGTRPLPIRDFDCIDYDFQFMLCNFTQPPNKLITQYNVSYNTNNDWHYSNSVDCNFDAAPVVTCNITEGNYRRFSETFYFRLHMTNALGDQMQSITINHYERTVPSRPGQNLTLVNSTESSVCLSWEMKQRSNYAHGLVWKVQVSPHNFEPLKRASWRNNSSIIKDTLCLTELPYAGYNYTLQLRVRGNRNNTIWSEPLVYNFSTTPSRPRRPPRVTYGSFYVDSSEEGVRFYWEPLEPHELNGPDFRYTISEYRINGTLVDPNLINVGRDSAFIDHWNMSGVHEFLIRSQNSEGLSVNATHMSIGPITNRDLRQRVPKNIHGVYQQTNESLTLTWEPPEDQRELTNYTVFWCQPKPGLLSECKGPIRFTEVPSGQLMFTTTRDKPTLLMAVSANYRSHNSGLRWPKCSSDKTDDLAKMEPSIDVTTSSTMTVSWGMEHVCAVILSGYNLTYCQRSTGRPDNCTTVVLNHYINKYVIQNLVPYTDYSVKMLMYSETRASKYSDELVNRTAEAAPSQPRELQLLRVTKSSVELSWKPPLLANGMVRAYEGTFRSLLDNVTESFRVPALISELVDTEKPITHTLGNLTAFTHYEVSVRARTLYPSEPSNLVIFRTAIGVPSSPTLQVTNNKDQSSRLDWHPPRTPAGRIDYYEVSLRDSNASCLMSTILPGHNRSFIMATPRCTSHNPFQLAVRAINVDRQPTGAEETETHPLMTAAHSSCEVRTNVLGEEERAQYEAYGANDSAYRLYKSEWGTYGYICTPDTNSVKAMYQTIEVTVAILVLGVIFYLVYKKYRKMSDIDLVLPQGIMETLKKPMDMGGLGLDLGPNSSVSGGIICTRVDDSPQYTPQDHLPHDFSSCGGESSKLLLRTASSSGGGGCMDRNGYDDHQETGPMSGAVPPPTSYLSMRHGLLVQSDSETEREREQESEREREREQQDSDVNMDREPTSGSSSNGYIKPTQMKSWAGNGGPVQPQPLSRVPLSGYVPVPILQSRLNPMPSPVQAHPQANANAPSASAAAAAASTFFPPAHMLNMDNYVQASDLHKLKPLAAAPLPSVGSGEGVAAAAVGVSPIVTASSPPPQPPFQLPVVAASTPTPMPTPKLADIGYTTMEQLQRTGLMKQPLSAAVGSPTHASGAATGGVGTTHSRLQPPINGYVTPQDLNVLAHNNRHVL